MTATEGAVDVSHESGYPRVQITLPGAQGTLQASLGTMQDAQQLTQAVNTRNPQCRPYRMVQSELPVTHRWGILDARDHLVTYLDSRPMTEALIHLLNVDD